MTHEQIIQAIRTDSQLRWHVIAGTTANAHAAFEKAHGTVDGEVFAEAASMYRADYRAGRA